MGCQGFGGTASGSEGRGAAAGRVFGVNAE
jgi:hypothetical protein